MGEDRAAGTVKGYKAARDVANELGSRMGLKTLPEVTKRVFGKKGDEVPSEFKKYCTAEFMQRLGTHLAQFEAGEFKY